jgi:short chain dehydrogenase
MGIARRPAGRDEVAMAAAKARVALVTGAAHGIGRAIARRLLDDGWRVGAVDLSGADLKRAYASQARRVALIEGDVVEEQTARDAVSTVTEEFGRLDALVSNAGIMIRKPLKNLTLADWRKVIDTNLTATYLFARAAEAPLRAARGAIVTIASTRALMSEPNTESYSASKGGLDQPRPRGAGELRQPRLDCGSRGGREGAAPQGPRPASRWPRRQAGRHCRDRRLAARWRALRLCHRGEFCGRRRDDPQDDLRRLTARAEVGADDQKIITEK